MKTPRNPQPSATTRAIHAADQAHLTEAHRSENWQRRGLLQRLTYSSVPR